MIGTFGGTFAPASGLLSTAPFPRPIPSLSMGKTTWLTWTLPFLYVVWANVHIQFVYGLFVLGLACTAPIIDRLRGPSAASVPRTTFLRADWWKLVGLTAACAAATLVNPYHVR